MLPKPEKYFVFPLSALFFLTKNCFQVICDSYKHTYKHPFFYLREDWRSGAAQAGHILAVTTSWIPPLDHLPLLPPPSPLVKPKDASTCHPHILTNILRFNLFGVLVLVVKQDQESNPGCRSSSRISNAQWFTGCPQKSS